MLQRFLLVVFISGRVWALKIQTDPDPEQCPFPIIRVGNPTIYSQVVFFHGSSDKLYLLLSFIT